MTPVEFVVGAPPNRRKELTPCHVFSLDGRDPFRGPPKEKDARMVAATILVIHDDAVAVAEVEALLTRAGYRVAILGDDARLRLALEQAAPAAVVLVSRRAPAAFAWDALQILWLDRQTSRLPIILSLPEASEEVAARLRGKRCIMLPTALLADMLLETLAIVIERPPSARPTAGAGLG
jgi:DNA-binding NtrC family response regulator